MAGYQLKALAALGVVTFAVGASTAAAGASTAAAATPHDGAADAGDSFDTAAAAYRAAFPNISAGAARSAAAGEDERKALYERLAGEDPATFGGAWFDPPTGVLHVAVTSESAAASAEKAASRRDVTVTAHVVRRSLASLERQADALREGRHAVGVAARGQIGIDIQHNRVVAAVPKQRVAAIKRSAVPAGVAIVPDRDLDVEEDAGCTARNACDSTIKAGSMLWRSGGGNVCSVGFTARDANNQRYTYTAGHCSNGNGVTWGTGGLQIGPMQASVNSGALDAAIIRVTNPWFASDSGGENYLQGAPGNSVPLNGVAPTVSYMLAGERVCLSANYTQPTGANRCGVIGTTSDWSVRGMTRVDGLDACGGDSGGGWYWLTSTGRRIAYGIHSRSDSGCNGSENGSQSWFTPIASVKSGFTPGLNVEIRP